MSSKYSPLTSTLLVRKGEAAPSSVKRKSKRHTNRKSNSTSPLEHIDIDSGEQSRTVVLMLSEQEYETLTLLAVKKGMTRQALAQSAMNAYLEWLISERGEG